VLLQDGEVKAVVGASGGIMIIAATTEVLLNHFVKGMDPFSSVTAPRVYHQVLNLIFVLVAYFFAYVLVSSDLELCEICTNLEYLLGYRCSNQ